MSFKKVFRLSVVLTTVKVEMHEILDAPLIDQRISTPYSMLICRGGKCQGSLAHKLLSCAYPLHFRSLYCSWDVERCY